MKFNYYLTDGGFLDAPQDPFSVYNQSDRCVEAGKLII